jgi:hypothetical protein
MSDLILLVSSFIISNVTNIEVELGPKVFNHHFEE